jgi:hypothetical protein
MGFGDFLKKTAVVGGAVYLAAKHPDKLISLGTQFSKFLKNPKLWRAAGQKLLANGKTGATTAKALAKTPRATLATGLDKLGMGSLRYTQYLNNSGQVVAADKLARIATRLHIRPEDIAHWATKVRTGGKMAGKVAETGPKAISAGGAGV